MVKNKTKGIVLAMWLVRRPQWGRENKFGHVGWIRGPPETYRLAP